MEIDYDRLAEATTRRAAAQQQAAQELEQRKDALDRAITQRVGTVRGSLNIQIAEDGHSATLRYGNDDYTLSLVGKGNLLLRNTRLGGREWRADSEQQLLTGIAELARPH